MKLRWLIMAAFGLALTALFVSAGPLRQSQSGTITGTVADEAGAEIPGVTVTAVELQTGARATAVTNESGAYTIAGLQPGIYTVPPGSVVLRVRLSQITSASEMGSALSWPLN